ncbi:DUF6194 family protein [Streptomyces katrae]|uniref:DUF6194 family protein n=1 Tax=Streptomyces katrae TaxID=68223 RepID=UPI0004BEE191|nr:DUF6194 family protein [Streptomyces katrae]
MTIDEITDFVGALEGVLAVRPGPGDGSPEISWGDTFFYHAPDGVVPAAAQPFATIVTKDCPGDAASRLDRPDTFRVNVAAGREEFIRRTGRAPRDPATDDDPGAGDTVQAHPVYGSLGWLAVVNPGRRTDTVLRELLRHAHRLARARHDRRTGTAAGDGGPQG